MIQPRLIVDVEAYTKEEFTRRKGLTPQQLTRLASEGFIIPNLYEYDSDSKRNFQNYEKVRDDLSHLFEHRNSRLRILSIRRKKFLDSMSDTFSECQAEGDGILRPVIQRLSPPQMEKLFRGSTPEEAMQKAASNWAYIRVLGAANERVKAWCNQLESDPEYVRQIADQLPGQLQARKSLVASISTAAFGGTHIIPRDQLHQFDLTLGATAIEDRNRFSRMDWSKMRELLAQFAASSVLREFQTTQENLADFPRLPRVLPAGDFDEFLVLLQSREQIVHLAQRHRRYGAGMIYLKLRQAGHRVNYKRVERLYAQQKLQVRRRRRKKILISERQPLERPSEANAVWSMDFVFDRVAGGRAIKNLAIVDDATHEAIAVVPEHNISGRQLVHMLEGICTRRGYCGPQKLDLAVEVATSVAMA